VVKLHADGNSLPPYLEISEAHGDPGYAGVRPPHVRFFLAGDGRSRRPLAP
jgi:hypothetical protein